MLGLRRTYVFSYNLLQFCGHTWILANTVARFLTFGRDAVADSFYSVGFVMSLCQLLSILELFHIADGIERAKLPPRVFQVTHKNLLLILVILQEDVQSQPVVCAQLFFWNILDLLRYPHELLCVLDTPSFAMMWTRYTLWTVVYVLSVASEGVTMVVLLYESSQIHPPIVLTFYLPFLTLGASLTVWQLLKEREHHLVRWNKKVKRK